jgi:hypothetical protein
VIAAIRGGQRERKVAVGVAAERGCNGPVILTRRATWAKITRRGKKRKMKSDLEEPREPIDWKTGMSQYTSRGGARMVRTAPSKEQRDEGREEEGEVWHDPGLPSSSPLACK